MKLFRKIREQLLMQNKTSKYFKYAIGEIVLVVIGILIALQINNWNEDRKRRTFESDILSLISENLAQDSIALDIQLKQSIKAQNATKLLLTQIVEHNYNDSLKYVMGDIINFQRFKSQSSGFEVLKAKGINNISNKTLRLALIAYYDNVLYQTNQSNLDIEKSFNADWVPEIKAEFSDFNWKEYATPKSMKEYLEKPSTTVLFKLFMNNRAGQKERLEKAIAKISEVRSLIKVNNDD